MAVTRTSGSELQSDLPTVSPVTALLVERDSMKYRISFNFHYAAVQ